jgi:DNA mismatch endonuclease, patch repair protein
MVDSLAPAIRSKLMARIRAKDTAPEMMVRSALHKRGLRFRVHDAKLPGRPDLVFSRRKTVVFVHGCFWHAHERCGARRVPASNRAYWGPKLQRNVDRDRRVVRDLRRLGWRVVIVWECQLTSECATKTLNRVAELLQKTAETH